jgi:hypothetical protein
MDHQGLWKIKKLKMRIIYLTIKFLQFQKPLMFWILRWEIKIWLIEQPTLSTISNAFKIVDLNDWHLAKFYLKPQKNYHTLSLISRAFKRNFQMWNSILEIDVSRPNKPTLYRISNALKCTMWS